jgi:hypothetical protein
MSAPTQIAEVVEVHSASGVGAVASVHLEQAPSSDAMHVRAPHGSP